MPRNNTGNRPANKGGGHLKANASIDMTASTKVWRIMAGLIMALLTAWNYGNTQAAFNAQDRARNAERRVRHLNHEIVYLKTNAAVVIMFLEGQKTRQTTAAKRQEYQVVIDTLKKKPPPLEDNESETEGANLRANQTQPPAPQRE